MSDLLELADRCEKAAEPDRELDVAIWLATTPGATRKDQVIKSSTGAWPDYTIDETRDASHRLVIVPAFTSSIDAAMTLVPEGWHVPHVGYVEDDEYKSGWYCEMVRQPDRYVSVGINDPMDFYPSDPGHVSTMPLAICAAALCAHANHMKGEA